MWSEGHGEGKEKSLEKEWPIMGPDVFSKSFTNGYLWSCPGFASVNTASVDILACLCLPTYRNRSISYM